MTPCEPEVIFDCLIVVIAILERDDFIRKQLSLCVQGEGWGEWLKMKSIFTLSRHY